MAIDETAVWAQIGQVSDPELDRSLSELGFVESVEIDGANVVVNFRLPTYWCASNFAFMMTADLRERVGHVAGVANVTVRLRDHFAEDEITEGVNAGRAFSDVFRGETEGELDELRATFLRKAFLVRQEQVLRALLRAGYAPEQLATLTTADVRIDGDGLLVRSPDCDTDASQTWRRVAGAARAFALFRQKRANVGIGATDADAHASVPAPLFTTADGAPLAPDRVLEHLRAARMVRLNGAFNTILCTALNRITHGVDVDADALCDETTPQQRAV